jgi:hypothetical protein
MPQCKDSKYVDIRKILGKGRNDELVLLDLATMADSEAYIPSLAGEQREEIAKCGIAHNLHQMTMRVELIHVDDFHSPIEDNSLKWSPLVSL